jgi:hypothetical protein
MSHHREQDCTALEQKLLDTDSPDGLLHDPAAAEHLRTCEACSELFRSLAPIKASLDQYTVREPSEEIMNRILDQARRFPLVPETQAAGWSKPGLVRIVAAGVAALPVVILINTIMGWALYEFAASFLPRSVAMYCISLFVLWASLGVSLSYASLPFLSLIPGVPNVREGPSGGRVSV